MREICGGDTIAALASAEGNGSRAVVRISGPFAFTSAASLVDLPEPLPPLPCALQLRFSANDFPAIPVLILLFASPRSYTGEDVAELHLPASMPLAKLVLDRLYTSGVLAAGRGEFTRRAFENGRLDLSAAQAVLDVITASDAATRRAALSTLVGSKAVEILQLQEELTDILMRLEADLDLSEEGIELLGASEAAVTLRTVADKAEAIASGGAVPSGLPRVVIAGPPNAGKTTLFNALTCSEGLVTPIPGTTSDPLRATLELNGLAVELWDTAGFADTSGSRPEAEERARELMDSADLLVLLTASPEESAGKASPERAILVVNKVDDGVFCGVSGGVARVSALHGHGLKQLMDEIAIRLAGSHRTAERHSMAEWQRSALKAAAKETREASARLDEGMPEELAAHHTRAAIEALNELTGRNVTEEVLDRIFSRFCLGK